MQLAGKRYAEEFQTLLEKLERERQENLRYAEALAGPLAKLERHAERQAKELEAARARAGRARTARGQAERQRLRAVATLRRMLGRLWAQASRTAARPRTQDARTGARVHGPGARGGDRPPVREKIEVRDRQRAFLVELVRALPATRGNARVLAERAAGLAAMAEPVAALEHREHLRTLVQLLRRLAVDPAGALYRGAGRAAKPDVHAVRLLERDGVLHAGWSVAAMVAAPAQHAAAVQQHYAHFVARKNDCGTRG